jgi:type I restriction enzyme S subunit
MTEWREVSLDQIIRSIQAGHSFKCDERPPKDGEIGVAKVSAVSWGRYQEQESKTCLDPARVAPDLFIRAGDFLLSRANTIELVGACVIADRVTKPIMLSDKILRINFDRADARWVMHFLRTPQGRKQIEALSTGNQLSMRNIGQAALREVRLPLPSLDEQRRIVVKLEDLLARSRHARDALSSIPPLLDKLRQSILAAAFRGDLTADWRAKNPDVEPAEDMLKRIRTERRKRWEAAELVRLREKGKLPTDDRWKSKYKDPDPVDHAKLPRLPEGWCWASAEQLATKIVDGVHHKPDYVEAGVPFLTVKNLTAGPGISFEATNFVSPEAHAEYIRRADPERGDLLISKDGTLGVTRLIRTETAFSIFVSLALVKPVDRKMGEYLEFAFQAPVFQTRFKSTGSGLLHIHLIDLRASALPVAPEAEQAEIVSRTSTLLGAASRTHAAWFEVSAQARALESACLAKAFRGELVAQDPNGEPASAAKERLATEAEPVRRALVNPRRGPRRKPRE